MKSDLDFTVWADTVDVDEMPSFEARVYCHDLIQQLAHEDTAQRVEVITRKLDPDSETP